MDPVTLGLPSAIVVANPVGESDQLDGALHDWALASGLQAADEQANVYGGCGPRLNEEEDPSEWLGKENGPAAKLDNEKPQGETIDYEELVERWQQG